LECDSRGTEENQGAQAAGKEAGAGRNKQMPDEVLQVDDGTCQPETAVKTAVLFTCEMWTIAKAPKQMDRN
jgi:hypothetical protein